MIPNATTMATSQIAILRVRGWCAISVARLRSSVILAAISGQRRNTKKSYRSCNALSMVAALRLFVLIEPYTSIAGDSGGLSGNP